MQKFEEKLFNLLTSGSGFYIKDYSNDKWISILDKGEGIYAVIVSNEENCDDDYNNAMLFLTQQYNKNINLNVVIYVKDNLHQVNINSYYNRLIYSEENKAVVYSSDSCKPLMPLLDYINKKEVKQKNWFKDNYITFTLIIINTLLFVISAVKSSNIYNINTNVLIDMGAKVNVLIDNGQAWRLITSAFLHGGLMHIFFNMYALKIIGAEVEYVYGKVKYILIYLVSSLGGSIFSYFFNANSVSVGASGAIFGLLGAMIIFAYYNRGKIGKEYIKGLIKVVIINIVIGITLSNIDNSAHLGGLIFGAILSLVFVKKISNAK